MKKVAFMLASALALTACQKQSERQAEPTVSEPASAQTTTNNVNVRTYTVVTELNTVPFIIRDPNQTGGVTGFEYDLLTEIAKQQGFNLKFELHPWQGIFTTLNDGKADIVAGAVTYTNERAKIMDFSQPHYEYHYAMLVREDLAKAKNFEGLRGKKIALQRGSVSESLIPMFGVKDGENVQYTDTIWLATKAVLSGVADGAVGSDAPLGYYAKEYPESKTKLVQDASLPAQHYVFAVKKGNLELIHKLNDGLAALKANGTYDTLYRKYWH